MKTSEDKVELKKIFRKLTKLLHPDINPDLSGIHKLLWNRVYEAYKNCDTDEIKTIELMIDMDNIVVDVISNEDELRTRKLKLEESIIHYLKKIETVKSTYPYKLIDIINNGELVSAELAEIDNQKENFMKQIEKYSTILNSLTLGGYVGFSLN